MIQKVQVEITPLHTQRKLHIYLPNNYYESQERYPVMYMFDGHNLFDDRDATYGKSWGLQKFLDQYDKPFILIGLECNHEGNERLNEFSPYTFSTPGLGNIYGKGDLLMRWMAEELKTWVDQRYRTYPNRECTGLGGSSMGGLMALYGVIRYNSFFSKAACLSPAVFGCYDLLMADLKKSDISPDTRVYMSLGSKEISKDFFLKQLQAYDQSFVDALNDLQASAVFHLVHGGGHNEASWEKENRIYFDYLWRR
ncbi:MAG TPA: alpha/beta hydrolase [Candidatus Faecalicoccus intestinipullorum]|nr:alpha/beta hydrolase [Candidatus Faecalicoccus intestinipullorum]